jgi:hypothetical protein
VSHFATDLTLLSVQLHNRFLVALLYNASSEYASIKRKRPGEDFDTDDSNIETLSRVHEYVMGLGARERGRMRRAMMEMEDEDEQEDIWAEVPPKSAFAQGTCPHQLSRL